MLLKSIYSVPTRLNRTKFTNKTTLNIFLVYLFYLLVTQILPFYYLFYIIVLASFAFYTHKFGIAILCLYYILFIITLIRLNITHLHDIESNGLWSIILFIPTINLIFSNHSAYIWNKRYK